MRNSHSEQPEGKARAIKVKPVTTSWMTSSGPLDQVWPSISPTTRILSYMNKKVVSLSNCFFFLNHLPSNRFNQFFERQMEFQGHLALVYARNNRLKPSLGSMCTLTVGTDLPLFLWCFFCHCPHVSLSFQEERKQRGVNPTGGLLWAASLDLCLWHPDLTGGTDSDAWALNRYTAKGLWRRKSMNIGIWILLNLGACYQTYKIKNQ